MSVLSVEELYNTYIKPLPVEERAQLIELTQNDLLETKPPIRNKRFIDFRGAGKQYGPFEDAQQRVNIMREEWDTPT